MSSAGQIGPTRSIDSPCGSCCVWGYIAGDNCWLAPKRVGTLWPTVQPLNHLDLALEIMLLQKKLFETHDSELRSTQYPTPQLDWCYGKSGSGARMAANRWPSEALDVSSSTLELMTTAPGLARVLQTLGSLLVLDGAASSRRTPRGRRKPTPRRPQLAAAKSTAVVPSCQEFPRTLPHYIIEPI